MTNNEMPVARETTSGGAELQRSLNLRGAVALNMLDMIGVGPFITLPLILAAMGGPQAMLGWILGAGLALCDGLVWAELGAAMPEAGGSYHFLRKMYPEKTGRFLAFLFIFQLTFSAPLSVASGCIGFSQYAAYLFPRLGSSMARHTATHMVHLWTYSAGVSAGPGTLVAIAAVLIAVWMLYRNLASVRLISLTMWCAVMALIAWILVTGVLHAHWAQAFTFPPGAFTLTPAFFTGLGSAMLIATYDYWGYYNITFLGGEVKDPARTVPRAILISIGLVAALYIAMNISVIAVLPWQSLVGTTGDLNARRAVISLFMETAYGPRLGPALGKLAAVLVMVTAFASVFSLLLGYSRIPYAAAKDGNYFRMFGKLKVKHGEAGGFPHVSLLVLGAAAIVFCFFSLADVIAALVVIRILLQFLMQHVGVMYLRKTQPSMPRPFRIWLYPLPPLVAIFGFLYILVERPNFQREIVVAAALIALGTVVYAVRESRPRAKAA
jgi:amino acid transporter